MEEKYPNLADLFKNPANEFRMMPFWFWNHEMVEKEVQRQIRDHQAHGIGGEFIHPRHGRLTPYMGKRWLENVEAAADQCKALDMPCFLYDEDNWPSGPAGGYITGPYRPENRGKSIGMFDEGMFEGGEHVEYELDYHKISEEATIYAAVAVPNPANYPNFADVIEKVIDVTDHVKGDMFVWDPPEGEWTVIFFAMLYSDYRGNLNGYIDILRKETVKEFIDFTHKRYVDWFIQRGKKDYLGTVVPGIFTDEPSMGQGLGGSHGMIKSILFTPEMPKKFKEMFGYDFNKILISMFYETGEIGAKHRCNYWKCATQLYVDAFYKQIYEYCDQYGIRTTGHVNCEGSFPTHIREQGDFFKVFEYMHYGGCDQLTEDVRPDGIEDMWSLDRNPYTGMANEMVLASKFASSAANLLGKPRVLVEAWGTSSWDITMASAKRVNDFLIATGCDLFVPHSFNYSEDSYRKGDHPAAFNYQSYYEHWKKISDYNGRLCAIFNAHTGVLVPDVLFFYPTKSFYAEMMPHHSLISGLMGDNFNHLADCLMRQQLDFEFANEDLILKSIVVKETIQIRNDKFKFLLLGTTTCVGIEFARWLEKYYEAGGKILAIGLLAFKEENTGDSAEVAAIMKKIFGINPKELYSQYLANKISEVKVFEQTNAAGAMAIFIQIPAKAAYKAPFYPAFEDACRKLNPMANRDVTIFKDAATQKHAAYIMKLHKTIQGKEFYFLANTSRNADYPNTNVTLNVTPGKVECWDAETGEIKEGNSYGVINGKTNVILDFPPYRSYVIVITPSSQPVADRKAVKCACAFSGTPIESIDLGKDWKLNLHGVNGAMLYKDWHAAFHVEAGDAWGYRGLRTFKHQFEIKELTKIKQVRLVIEGLVGDYAWCKDTIDMPRGGDRAHFEFPGNVSISVNGKPIRIKFDFTPEFLDPCWLVADISKELVEGVNEVFMECRTHNHQAFHVVNDPWRLIGDFHVDERDGIPLLQPIQGKLQLGNYSPQGLARVHGGVGYNTEFDVDSKYSGKNFRLTLKGTKDCVEVIVNGQNFGPAWTSWDKDITSAIKVGQKNKIELIYFGTAQNMLQTNIKTQGLEGNVLIEIY
jgi:hypothetical protein